MSLPGRLQRHESCSRSSVFICVHLWLLIRLALGLARQTHFSVPHFFVPSSLVAAMAAPSSQRSLRFNSFAFLKAAVAMIAFGVKS
jgi:hypothetical protein